MVAATSTADTTTAKPDRHSALYATLLHAFAVN